MERAVLPPLPLLTKRQWGAAAPPPAPSFRHHCFCSTKKNWKNEKIVLALFYFFILIVELRLLRTYRRRFQRCNLRGIPGKTISSLDVVLVVAVKTSEKRLRWIKISIASLVKTNTVIVFAAAFTFKTFP